MQDATSGGLAAVPPGAELYARVARADLGSTQDAELPELLNAAARQLSHQQAQLWEIMAEIARRDPMVGAPGGRRWTPEQVFDSAVDEVRAELLLTRRAAEREVTHAALVGAEPRIAIALTAGVLDRARAVVLAEGCAGLTEPQVGTLLDAVLPDAGTVTVTRLAEKVQKIAIALDPGWVERRYKQAVRERRVVGYLNRDGSATVSGQNLAADEATAACARVDALASAAKRSGAAAKIDHLRAEIFLGLLDGRFHAMTEADIVHALLRQFPKTAPTQDQPTPGAEVSAAPGESGVELRVGLGTLLGDDDRPGEIAGWGPVTAAVARTIAGRQRTSEWRFAIVDAQGQLLFDGIARRRPRGEADAVQQRGGIVELHVPLSMLSDPAVASDHPQWARLLAELASQYSERQPIEQDPTARFAGRPLRRRTQIRFARCVFAGCRRPASECDLDHHHDWARGGRTGEQNIGPGCRHDHKLKTSGGWRLIRRDDTTYLWISPLGRKHLVPIEPVAPPLPDPIPRVLPPEQSIADVDLPGEPPPTFSWATPRGRPLELSTDRTGAVEMIQAAHDPPPF